jgi:cytochrome c1
MVRTDKHYPTAAVMTRVMICVLSTLVVSCSAQEPSTNVSVAAVRRGAAVVTRVGCDACHVIGSTGNTRIEAAAPLAGISERTFIAGVLPNTQANLARWIYDPRAIKARTNMPRLDITMAESADVAAYLYSLR